MSSAICFSLDQSKILSSGNGLICIGTSRTLYSLAKLFFSVENSYSFRVVSARAKAYT